MDYALGKICLLECSVSQMCTISVGTFIIFHIHIHFRHSNFRVSFAYAYQKPRAVGLKLKDISKRPLTAVIGAGNVSA